MSDTTEGQGAAGATTSLEDIFDRSKQAGDEASGGQPEASPAPAEPAAETGDKPPAEAKPEQPRDEHGRFVSKPGEAAQAAPPAAEGDPQHVPFAALKDERTKRQTLETQLSDLQRQLEEFRLKQQQPPAPPPEPVKVPHPVEDPEGYHRFIEDRQFNDRLNISEMMAREKYQDVDAKLAVFQEAVKDDPSLGLKLRTQAHPWDWMYQQAQRIEAMKDIGDDPAAYRARIESEIRAKIASEASAAPSPAAPTTPLPTSLASARSVGERTPNVPAGPTPLDQAVRFRG